MQRRPAAPPSPSGRPNFRGFLTGAREHTRKSEEARRHARCTRQGHWPRYTLWHNTRARCTRGQAQIPHAARARAHYKRACDACTQTGNRDAFPRFEEGAGCHPLVLFVTLHVNGRGRLRTMESNGERAHARALCTRTREARKRRDLRQIRISCQIGRGVSRDAR